MLIKELKILTKNLKAQREFYSQVLELVPVSETYNSISFRIGKTLLILEESDNFQPYHFAINIPSHNEIETLEFIQNRVELLKHEGSEIINYDNWNAHSLYFYDADHNIVELISRNNLNYSTPDHFSQESLIEISEIGLATNNIKEKIEQLQEATEIEIYDGSFERFCAIGDEKGLFICIDKNQKTWFPTSDTAFSSAFKMLTEISGINYSIEFHNDNLLITSIII